MPFFDLFLNFNIIFWASLFMTCAHIVFIKIVIFEKNIYISKSNKIYLFSSAFLFLFTSILSIERSDSYSENTEKKLCALIFLEKDNCKVYQYHLDKYNKKKIELIITKKEKCIDSRKFILKDNLYKEDDDLCVKEAKFEVFSQEAENFILIGRISHINNKIYDPKMIESLKKASQDFLRSNTIN